MRNFVLVVTALAVVALLGSVAYLLVSGRQRGEINPPRIITAARAYADDLKSKGTPVPPAVSLKELISRGFLTEKDVSGFKGMEVSVSLSLENARPQDVLMRARLADGQELVVLMDGSVQELRK